jgi:hypothetical protein
LSIHDYCDLFPPDYPRRTLTKKPRFGKGVPISQTSIEVIERQWTTEETVSAGCQNNVPNRTYSLTVSAVPSFAMSVFQSELPASGAFSERFAV